jgi:hypothetical protein
MDEKAEAQAGVQILGQNEPLEIAVFAEAGP